MALKIYGDFQNADPDGNIRLNTIGTEQDLKSLNIELTSGLETVITDGELEADGVVKYSDIEKIWVAEINWKDIRET